MNDFDGIFVSVEGLDGAGTTTLCRNLKEELDGWEFTHEPSNGKYGRIVQEELRSDSDPTMSDFFLFLADRYDHCESLIGPKLDAGANVITDRYNLSTYAYQSQVVWDVDGVNPGYIEEVVEPWVITPDVTILLDIPVEECLNRISGEEKYETKSRLLDARRQYRSLLFEREHVVKVDATQSEEEVLQESLEIIDENR